MREEAIEAGRVAGRISKSLAALGRGEPGPDLATARQDLARRRAIGA
jgi:hypothetical protein